MKPNIDKLKTVSYVRRVIESEGVIGALTNDSVNIHDRPKELIGAVSFHAPMSVVGAAECVVLWDRVAEMLKQKLAGTAGILQICHRWCGEGEMVEIDVGRKQDLAEHRFSVKETEERPLFPEGVYAIVVEPTKDDAATALVEYETSFVSQYKAERDAAYELEEQKIQAQALKEFAKDSAEYVNFIRTQTQNLLDAFNETDTEEARAAYVAKEKAAETRQEKNAYLAGAKRGACMERVSNALGNLLTNPWDVEFVFQDMLDERYKEVPC